MDALNHSPATDFNLSGRPPDDHPTGTTEINGCSGSLHIDVAQGEPPTITSETNMMVDSPAPMSTVTERSPSMPLSYASIVTGQSLETNKLGTGIMDPGRRA
ncbi:unnamed protein product [Linum trigynum]|uniref:Uncharacterized protein n=1 Tax=Linum trigynum TaxID=586398 RepID=A0AAV2GLJ1_9ROSI